MKKIIICAISLVIMLLTACQVNNIKDTGGGAVSPSSTVTGVSMGGDA
ncbi:colicin release lysis protein [Salmonella enterica subsp. enterica serovar Bareilly]|nr:lysis protein [Salmonella enterica]EGF6448597.1 colicin release lysis protein [Salmonella enterica subsp. enterica]EIW3690644.1 colicin release lysis protein [Salmonella enterica]EJD7639790.1 colicin release lysis protein [Salmonella enterica]